MNEKKSTADEARSRERSKERSREERRKQRERDAEERCRASYPFCNQKGEGELYRHMIPDISINRDVNSSFNSFYRKIMSDATPYKGRQVFISRTNRGRLVQERVCPEYNIHINKNIAYGISIARDKGTNRPTGFLYIYFLQDYKSATDHCVYIGDHITLGSKNKETSSKRRGADLIHFHFTYVIEGESSQHKVECSIPIRSLERVINDESITKKEKIEEIKNLSCLDRDGIFNKGLLQNQMVNHYRSERERDSLIEFLYDLFRKGFTIRRRMSSPPEPGEIRG